MAKTYTTYTITLTHEQREKLEDLSMRMNNMRGMFLIRDEVAIGNMEGFTDRLSILGYQMVELIDELILTPSYDQDMEGKK